MIHKRCLVSLLHCSSSKSRTNTYLPLLLLLLLIIKNYSSARLITNHGGSIKSRVGDLPAHAAHLCFHRCWRPRDLSPLCQRGPCPSEWTSRICNFDSRNRHILLTCFDGASEILFFCLSLRLRNVCRLDGCLRTTC